jgi:hypothetical protein
VQDGKHRVISTVQIDSKHYHTKLDYTLGEGRPFIVAGEKHDTGILIYVLYCKTPN